MSTESLKQTGAPPLGAPKEDAPSNRRRLESWQASLVGLVGGRINEEIQRELSSLFRTLKDPRVQSGMVTITHVDTTSDLRYSRIYVSVLEKSLEKDVIRGLKSAAGYLRRELGANMSLRYTPELQFIADDSIEYGAHILEMLRDPRVVKPANPENETLNTEDEQE